MSGEREGDAALAALDRSWAMGRRPKDTPMGTRMDSPKQGQTFFASAPFGAGPALLFLWAPWLIGWALAIYLVVQMRWGDVPIKLLVGAGALLVVGALLTGVRSRVQYNLMRRPPEGLLLSPLGAYVLEGEKRTFVGTRDQIEVGAVHGGALEISGPTGKTRVTLANAGAVQSAVTGWGADGTVHGPPTGRVEPQGSRVPLFRVGSAIGFPAAVVGAIYLIAVMPVRSELGQRAEAFFKSIRDDDVDAAHDMLTLEQQGEDIDSWKATLPDEVRSHTGFTINGVSHASAVNSDQDRGCVEGWLDVGGKSKTVRLTMRTGDDGSPPWRIHSIAMETCRFWRPSAQ